MALYIVATPIGNLSDATFRSLETLKSVDIIACEDTRNTSILCDRYEIKTRLMSYHKYSENERLELFLDYLKEGKSIALVSDAGTPLISDPGEKLVDAVVKEGFKVVPIVGACAITALLSSIPRKNESFKFVGFLPKTQKHLEELVQKNEFENLVFYESPKRLLKSIEIIKNALDNPRIAIGRELTKKFEEILVDNCDNMLKHYSSNTLKGELAGMIYAQEEKFENSEIKDRVEQLKALGLSNKDISSTLSSLFGYSKNEVYKLTLS